MSKIFPSLIACNPELIDSFIHNAAQWCAGFHIDISDSRFIPNAAFTLSDANRFAQQTKLPLWIHLMVEDPEKYSEQLSLKAGDIVSVHYESFPRHSEARLIKLFEKIRAHGAQASLALKPTTPLEVIAPLASALDHVLIMSVEPGRSGQDFLPTTIARLTELKHLKEKFTRPFAVGIDGGITEARLREIQPFHLDTIAIGSALFRSFRRRG